MFRNVTRHIKHLFLCFRVEEHLLRAHGVLLLCSLYLSLCSIVLFNNVCFFSVSSRSSEAHDFTMRNKNCTIYNTTTLTTSALRFRFQFPVWESKDRFLAAVFDSRFLYVIKKCIALKMCTTL